MRAIVFGATGMIGQGLVRECLKDPDVASVLAVSRRALAIRQRKLEELVHDDLFDLAPVEDRLEGYDACFFCLGVSSAGMSEEDYSRLTFTLTLEAAERLARLNPAMTFCYVSGAGTDSSEEGRIMWARVKGRTENALLALPFKAAYMFRPGLIQPLDGIRSRTKIYNLLYTLLRPFSPLLRLLLPAHYTTTTELGRALIQAARGGFERPIVESRDIRALAG